MSEPAAPATPEQKQARVKEFMALLPLTIEIAGLPDARPDQLFTADQMDARTLSIKTAYKLARGLVREVAE